MGKQRIKRKLKELEKLEETKEKEVVDDAEERLYKIFVGLNYKHREEIEAQMQE